MVFIIYDHLKVSGQVPREHYKKLHGIAWYRQPV